MKEFEVDHIRQGDVSHIGRRLRPADRREIEAFGMDASPTSLQNWVDRSVWAMSLRQKGFASAIFGLGGSTDASDVGIELPPDTVGFPWMVGTSAIDALGVGFIRACRPVVQRMLDDRSVLVNLVHADHVKARRWLGWLGFRFEPPLSVPITNASFIPFWMARPDCEHWAASYITAIRRLARPLGGGTLEN